MKTAVVVAVLVLSAMGFGQDRPVPKDELGFAFTVSHTTYQSPYVLVCCSVLQSLPGETYYGVNITGHHNLTRRVGLESEFDAVHHNSSYLTAGTATQALGGPRIQFPNHSALTPYIHGLAGVSHQDETDLTALGGGGVEIRLSRYLALREGADYGWVNTHGNAQRGFRAITGVVFTFGAAQEPSLRTHTARPSTPSTSATTIPKSGIEQHSIVNRDGTVKQQ